MSEIRLKLSLETAPGQRPHGVLGIWSPVLSAVGNAFKIQVTYLIYVVKLFFLKLFLSSKKIPIEIHPFAIGHFQYIPILSYCCCNAIL